MDKKFIEANIVLLGNFKTTFLDKLFFIEKNLITEESFLDSTVFTPNFSKIETNSLVTLIEPDKIILGSKINKSNLLKFIALSIIESDYAKLDAVGFNFKWFIFIDDINKHTKSRFLSPTNKILNQHFNDDNTIYGYYLSKNFKRSIMKLDIKPSLLKEISGENEQSILSFDFNFHIEAETNNIKILTESLKDYKSYEDKVKEIVSEYE